MTKKKINLWIDEYLIKKAKDDKYNISQFLEDTLKITLGTNDTVADIEDEIQKTKTQLSALEVKKSQLKELQGTTLNEYLNIIDSSTVYSKIKKEEIKEDVLKSIELIKTNISFTAGRIMLLKRRHNIEITSKMLIKFAELKEDEQIP